MRIRCHRRKSSERGGRLVDTIGSQAVEKLIASERWVAAKAQSITGWYPTLRIDRRVVLASESSRDLRDLEHPLQTIDASRYPGLAKERQ